MSYKNINAYLKLFRVYNILKIRKHCNFIDKVQNCLIIFGIFKIDQENFNCHHKWNLSIKAKRILID